MNPDDIIPDSARTEYEQSTTLSDLSKEDLRQELRQEAMTSDISNPGVVERIAIIRETYNARLEGRRPVY